MPKNHLTTDQIIQGCRRKDSLCQRALVEEYSELLFTVCLRYCNDRSSAEDVLQDSFIRIFKSFKNFDPDKGSLQAWMRKITVNMALKSISKRKKESLSMDLELVDHAVVNPSVIEKMKAEDLIKLIGTLPEGYRQVFNLSVIEGYSHNEIGEMLGIEAASSRSNLSRAKQFLRKKLKTQKKTEQWVRIV